MLRKDTVDNEDVYSGEDGDVDKGAGVYVVI